MAFPFATMAQSQPTFELQGKNIKNTKKVYVMHYSYADGSQVVDSAKVVNGSFSLKKEFGGPAYAGILLRENLRQGSRDDFWFYLNPGKTVVDFKDSPKVVDGGAATKQYMAYQEEMDKSRAVFRSEEYRAKRKEIDSLSAKVKALQISLLETYGNPMEGSRKVRLDFIQNHPDNGLSLVFLEDMAGSKPDVDLIAPLLHSLSPAIQDSYRGKRLANLLKGMGLVEGAKAIDFTQADTQGKPVKLSDFRGKYVLIDFWASWCVPCRQENPNLVKAYAAYKSKNFEILAVSLDNKKENWLKAIEDDKLSWVHVSDLKGWDNTVAGAYAIRAVPNNYLIDPNGIIIARNLRGEALEAALAKYLN